MIAHDLPLDEVLELVRRRYIVLVRLNLLVSFHDAQVDAGKIDLPRVLLLTVSDEREVGAKVLCSLLDVVLRTRLVVQQTQLQGSISLRFFVCVLLIAQVKNLH